MKFFAGHKGSISIILIIILLPMLTLGGIVLDISRMNYAKSIVSSSGELAMNAALADYDSVVQDVYGIFAMSQLAENPSEALETNVKAYFKNTLIDNNVMTESEAEDYVANLLNETFDGDFKNFLEMSVEDITVQGVPNSDLGEPTILKKQIVEYMKYRGPLTISTGFIDSLDSFTKVGKQTEVIESKLVADEALGEIQAANNELYKFLKDFDKTYALYKSDVLESKMNAMQTALGPADQNVIDVFIYDKPYVMENGSKTVNSDPDLTSLDTAYNAIGNIDGIVSKDYKLLQDYLKAFNDAKVNSRKKTLEDDIKDLESENEELDGDIGVLDSKIDQENAKENPSSSRIAGYKADIKKKEQSIEDNTEEIAELTSKIEALEDYFEYYDAINTKASNLYNACLASVDAFRTPLKDIQTQTNYIINLNYKLLLIKSQIGTIDELVTSFNTKKEAFEGKISKYESETSGKSDMFSTTMQSDVDNKMALVDLDALKELDARVQKDTEYFTPLFNSLKNIEYRGSVYFDPYGRVNNNILNIASNAETAQSLADIYISNNAGTFSLDITAYRDFLSKNADTNTIMSNNHDVLSMFVPPLKYCEYLKKEFKDQENSVSTSDTEEYTKVKSEVTNLKTSSESTSEAGASYLQDENATLKLLSTFTQPVIPSKGTTSTNTGMDSKSSMSFDSDFEKASPKVSGSFSNITSVATNLSDSIAKLTRNARDDIYVLEYIFNNFSSGITEKEYDDNVKLTLSNYNIDSTSNYFYGGEIEYILYGKDSLSANVSTAKTHIFGIRFGLNAIFAFTDGGVRSETFASAGVISAATLGVVPVPLIQAILQLSLALAESVYDMHRLNDAKQVALIKTPSTWSMSIRGSLNVAKEVATDAATTTIKETQKFIENAFDAFGEDVKSMTAEELEAQSLKLSTTITQTVREEMESVSSQAINMFVECLENELSNVYYIDGKLIDPKSLNIEEKLESSIQNAANTAKGLIKDYITNNDIISLVDLSIQSVADKLVDYIKSDEFVIPDIQVYTDIDTVITSLSSYANSKADEYVELALDYMDEYRSKITKELSKKLTDSIDKYKKLGDEKINNVGEKVMEEATQNIDEVFGSLENNLPVGDGTFKPTGNVKSSGFKAAIKFSYEDYIKLFVFLNLATGKEDVTLKRMSDLMQTNMNYGSFTKDDKTITHTKKGSLALNEAYSYVSVESNLSIDPFFVKFDFFNQLLKEDNDEFSVDELGNLHYRSVLGY